MAVNIHDSPISKLQLQTQLSSVDLFLTSQKLNNGKFSSKRMTYNDVACNMVSSMSHELSTIVQKELSSVIGGTVTLTTWKNV